MSRREEVKYCKRCNNPIKICTDTLYDTWNGKQVAVMIDPVDGKRKINITSSHDGRRFSISKFSGRVWVCNSCIEVYKKIKEKR